MPFDFNKIAGQIAVTHRGNTALLRGPAANATLRNGRQAVLEPFGAGRERMRTPSAERKVLNTAGNRPLSSHTVVAQAPVQPMQPQQAIKRMVQMGVKPSSRAQGRSFLLRGGKNIPKSAAQLSDEEAEEQYMALWLARAALAEDLHEDAATALLTPVEGEAHTKEELADLLREKLAASEHEEDAFEHFMDEVLEDVELTSEERSELSDKLRDARNDDDLLMDLMRDAQKLSVLGRDARDLSPQEREANARQREALRHQIDDAIQELDAESTGKGQEVLASFNTAPVAAGTADPQAFRQMYKEIVAVSRSFASTLKVLVTRFPPEVLKETVGAMLKALAADMDAATPSRDLRRLGAVVEHIGNMTVSRTFIEMVFDLIDQLYRLPEMSHAQRG
jgi:hypothetical protein